MKLKGLHIITILSLFCLFTFQIVVFGQTENFWTKKADFSGLKRSRAIAFSINDMGYIGTGIDTSESVFNDLWQYDPVLDSWAQKANLPGVGRRNAVAFEINGNGYVGCGMSHAQSQSGNALKDFWKYDPVNNQWSSIDDFDDGRIYFATGFSIGNKGYVCGGKYGPNDYSDELWEYDPSTDSWDKKEDFPGGVRYQLTSFSISNFGYVGLGTDQDMHRKDLWRYDPSNDQWTQKVDFPASERACAHSFVINDKGYICMGTNGAMLDDLWQYDPIADYWSVKATYGGSPRKNGVAFVALGKGYVGSGKGYSGKKQSFWAYTPQAYAEISKQKLQTLKVSPNPASNVVSISFKNRPFSRIELYSIDGEVIMSLKDQGFFSIQGLESGAYFVVLKDKYGVVVGKEKLIIN
ncbi:MAG: kelch repeat-containing protein [Crocinitomicaceae bacterium]|nr:kelch repeat-containing protein [Crocinitomicaceae bacterium]